MLKKMLAPWVGLLWVLAAPASLAAETQPETLIDDEALSRVISQLAVLTKAAAAESKQSPRRTPASSELAYYLLLGISTAVPNVSRVDAPTRTKLHLADSKWRINERLITLSPAAVLWLADTPIQDKALNYLLRRASLYVAQGGTWKSVGAGELAQTQPSEVIRGVAIYAGVDGVSYSSTGERFGAYWGYEPRVAAILLPASEVANLAQRLRTAGLQQVAGAGAAPQFDLPPQAYDFLIVTNREQRRFRYWHAKGAQVPEGVLAVLASLPAAQRPAVINQLISANRQLANIP